MKIFVTASAMRVSGSQKRVGGEGCNRGSGHMSSVRCLPRSHNPEPLSGTQAPERYLALSFVAQLPDHHRNDPLPPPRPTRPTSPTRRRERCPHLRQPGPRPAEASPTRRHSQDRLSTGGNNTLGSHVPVAEATKPVQLSSTTVASSSLASLSISWRPLPSTRLTTPTPASGK